MEVRYSPDKNGFKKMSTEELRASFLIENLFKADEVPMVYSDIDRSITGSAVPVAATLKLTASKKEMAAEYFCERREVGIINIGGRGAVSVDGKEFVLENKDGLYIGRGVKEVQFSSADQVNPSKFYFVSYPAHKEFPSRKISFADATERKLGSAADANRRIIRQYIHPGTMETCQIVMGLTELDEGSVWNTMPAHTHQRRSEVYMYFGITPDSFVVHINGSHDETRHIIVRNEQAVLNPSWSLHSGCGTRNYSFIWAMGGENQVFDDMDHIPMPELK